MSAAKNIYDVGGKQCQNPNVQTSLPVQTQTADLTGAPEKSTNDSKSTIHVQVVWKGAHVDLLQFFK